MNIIKTFLVLFFIMCRYPISAYTQELPAELLNFCMSNHITPCSQSKKLEEIDFSYKNSKGDSLLHLVVEKGNARLVHFIIEHAPELINKPNNIGNTPLHLAAKQRDTEDTKILLLNGANINSQNQYGDTPLLFSFYHKAFSVALFLLSQKGLNVSLANFAGLTPLHILSYMGLSQHLSILWNYPDQHIDVNAIDRDKITALHYAAGNGHDQAVKFLVEHNANLTPQDNIGNTPLYNAALKGNLDIVKYLITKGASTEILGQHKRNILHAAVLSENTDLIRFLLQTLSLVNGQDEYKKTPLALAQERLSIENIKLLASYTNLSLRNNKKQTPIMQIIESRRKDLYEYYFNLPHSYQERDKEQNNLLHYCAKYQVPLFVLDEKILTESDFFKKNASHKTPWDLALQFDNIYMVRYYFTHFSKLLLLNIHFKALLSSLKKEKKYLLAKEVHQFMNEHKLMKKKKIRKKSKNKKDTPSYKRTLKRALERR